MTDARDEFWKYCAHCGATLGLTDWPPLVETTDDDGDVTIHSFCDENCRSAWRTD